MTAPAIPLCAAPDAHPTTCPCPAPVPVVQVRRPRVGTFRGRRVKDVTWRAPAATTETSDMTDIEISDPHSIGEAHGCPEECPAHNPGGPDVDPATVAGVPTELRDLPVEARHLVDAVTRMLGDWPESSEERRRELWAGLDAASEAVWNRTIPDAASQSRSTPDNPATSGDTADNPGVTFTETADGWRWDRPERPGQTEASGVGYLTEAEARADFALYDAEDRQAAADELTAEEARELADQLGFDLYRAQDAIAFVEECCVIADREGQPVTTALVREWLQGPKCARQMAAGVPALPERAQAAIRTLEQQVQVRDEQLAAVRRLAVGYDADDILAVIDGTEAPDA